MEGHFPCSWRLREEINILPINGWQHPIPTNSPRFQLKNSLDYISI